MAPQVQLSEATFNRLKKYAEPLVDTIESVINKMIDSHEMALGSQISVSGSKDYGGTAPNLTHTKVLSVEISGKHLNKSIATWNGLLLELIAQAASKLKDVDALMELIVVPHVKGPKEDAGYKFIPQAGISVQGQDANAAWKAASHIAKNLHIPVRVHFMWYENEKAIHPGQTGKLTLNMS